MAANHLYHTQMQQHLKSIPIAPHPQQPATVPRKRLKYSRRKMGCLSCRGRKVKCDEARPICTRCEHSQRECIWPAEISKSKEQQEQQQQQQEAQYPPTASESAPTTSSGYHPTASSASDSDWLSDWGAGPVQNIPNVHRRSSPHSRPLALNFHSVRPNYSNTQSFDPMSNNNFNNDMVNSFGSSSYEPNGNPDLFVDSFLAQRQPPLNQQNLGSGTNSIPDASASSGALPNMDLEGLIAGFNPQSLPGYEQFRCGIGAEMPATEASNASINMTEPQPPTSQDVQTHNVGSLARSTSDDSPSDNNSEVKHIPWIKFVTLDAGKRGWYRPRRSAPVAYGGFSDVWLCDARLSSGIQPVAAKRLRASTDDGKLFQKLAKRLMTELNIWMALQHPNIAPLLGYTFTPEMCLISPWLDGGNLAKFISTSPSVNRTNLVKGIAEGLAYLHSQTAAIVHGDIKPDNVLIDKSGIPLLIDFGLSKILESDPDLASHSCTSLRGAGNDRWIAPELLLLDGVSRACSSDVYSFGCLAFFTFTGDIPFKELPERRLAVARCLEKAQPIGPGVTYPVLDAVFGIMNILSACWKEEPEERPTMLSITQQSPLL